MAENYGPIINLRPVEEVTTSGNTQENLPDIDGVVIELPDGVADVTYQTPYTVKHRLDKTPKGMICFWKDGFSDVYFDNEDDEEMDFNREDDSVVMKVMVY